MADLGVFAAVGARRATTTSANSPKLAGGPDVLTTDVHSEIHP